jgi:hypothetical protein
MSALDGFLYNFMTMGPMFPWVYLSGLAAFPSASISLSLLIAFVIEIPICISYSWLSQRIKGDGGDYIFQTEAFGAWGSAVVFSGFVIWPLQWVATLGWLFSSAGLAPLLYTAGASFKSHKLVAEKFVALGSLVQSRGGLIVTSLVVVGAALYVLEGGLRRFARMQRALFVLTACSLIAVLLLFTFGAHNVPTHLDEFSSRIATLLPRMHLSELRVIGLRKLLVFDTLHHFYEPRATFGWFGTLAVVPIAWTSLQWATFSVEQNGQIENSGSVSTQMRMTLIAAASVTLVMIGVVYAEAFALGGRQEGATLLRALAAAQDSSRGYSSPSLAVFMNHVLEPFPNVLAMASTDSIVLVVLIAIGLMANAFQVLCSCFIGAGYIVRTMAEKNDLPALGSLLRLESTTRITCDRCRNPARNQHSHFGVYRIYALASVPVILGYNLVPEWSTYTLGLTFACGYVFMFSALAAYLLSRKRKSVIGAKNRQAKIHVWYGRAGLVGFVLTALLLGQCLLISQLGLNGRVPMLYVAVILLASLLLVKRSRKAVVSPPVTHRPVLLVSGEPNDGYL